MPLPNLSSNTSIEDGGDGFTTCRMATLAERIRELRARSGLSQAKFGVPFGVSREAVSQWESGKSKPGHDIQKALAERYKVTLDWIAGKDIPPENSTDLHAQKLVATTNSGGVVLGSGTASFYDQPRDLPILGSVKAGEVGFFLDNGEIQGMCRRPPLLQGIKGAFAVYVRDDSMIPAYEPGWLVHVHPTRPTAPGNNVVIEMHDGQAFIKRLVRRTEKHVICKQWNPAQEIRYDADKVKSVFLVVGSAIEE